MDSGRYCLEDGSANPNRPLHYIRVDGGGPPDHVVRKCAADVEKRVGVPALAKLIEQDRFVIAVVTAHDAKVAQIQDALRRRAWRIRFHVVAFPELAPLITRPPGLAGL